MREPGAPVRKPHPPGPALAPPADSSGDDRAAGTGRGGLRALRVRDPGGTSLRRAARVALVGPPMAAFAGTIVGDPGAGLFAVFGAFALLGLADFGGPTIPRARVRGRHPGRGWAGPAWDARVRECLFVVVLFDLIQPQGWRLGLIRLEDVALGIAVSLVVAVLLWPRGARGQLRSALAALYRADAACLDAGFAYLLGHRGEGEVDTTRWAAAAEAERAGEAFDVFLIERGSRMLPMVTWGRVAAAGNDVLLAADAMEAMGLLGYRPHGCEQCADRVRGDVDEVVACSPASRSSFRSATFRQPPHLGDGRDARCGRRVPAGVARSPGLPTGPNRDRAGHRLVLERGDRPPRRRAGPTPCGRGHRRPIPLVAMTRPSPS
jgi:hypothetical protein